MRLSSGGKVDTGVATSAVIMAFQDVFLLSLLVRFDHSVHFTNSAEKYSIYSAITRFLY